MFRIAFLGQVIFEKKESHGFLKKKFKSILLHTKGYTFDNVKSVSFIIK